MNTSVENYFVEGCLRCPLGATPDCKVLRWIPELTALREIILTCGLTEKSKWGVPCYTFEGKNICILSALKDDVVLSFFKGSLLSNEKGMLEKPGPNSQAARLIKVRSIEEMQNHAADIKAAIFEAIEVERAGLKVEFKKNPEPIPEELEARFEEDPMLKAAFEALTPGRQRGYTLHFSQPKQAKTRISRIEKCTPMILSGIGLHDKYQSRRKGK